MLVSSMFQAQTEWADEKADDGTTTYQDKPSFSPKRGFYTDALDLTLSTDDVNATIRYTLDGSTPSSTNGTKYTQPFTISGTSVVRAIAYYSDGTVSEVATHTYIFVADVVTQCSSGQRPNSLWPLPNTSNSAGQIIDYGMDPDIVNSLSYASLVDDALLAIPSISLVTDLPNLFDEDTGIYVNAREDTEEWERPASIELIHPDGKDGFQINAGIRIRGGVSRDTTNPKHAFRLFFRSSYGESRLKYSLFGNEGVDSFDKLDLRTSQNYSWSKEGSSKHTMVREVWSRDTQHAMGHPYTRSRYYHLYLDGIYWGIYQTQERSEAAYAESYFGGSEDDYDVMKVDSDTHTVVATDGNTTLWKQLWQAAVSGFSTDTAYYSIQGMNSSGQEDPSLTKLADIDNLIDYMILIYYTGDRDAPISAMLQNSQPNNFYTFISRVTPEGFAYFAHDAECSLLSTTEDRTGPYSVGAQFNQFNPQWLLQRMMSHPEFCMRFADRVQKHLCNGGVLSSEKASARFLTRANEIDTAIIAESARWGDAKSTKALTRDDWDTAVNYVIGTYFPARPAVLITQLRTRGWFPAINSPTVLRDGSAVSGRTAELGDSITLSASSTYIYYTLSGEDPRLPVSVSKDDSDVSKAVGAVSSEAIRYTGAIQITEPTSRLMARAFTGSVWSALTDLTFVTGSPLTDLRVTEIMYHPADEPDGDPDAEFIELQNIGDEAIGLTGIKFTDGVLFEFTEGDLEPGAYALIVKDQTAFETIYGTGLPVYGTYTGSLDNAGETICLKTTDDDTILEFVFSDEWQPTTDGVGYSLTFNDATLSDTDAWGVSGNWHASSIWGGTPGTGENVVEEAPTAAFTASVTSGDAPLSVVFTDASDPGSASITAWSWSFGDGSVGLTQHPTHIYTSAGTYTVSLSVMTSVGTDTETKTGYIVVTEAGPTAAFTASSTSGLEPLSVAFTDTSTAGSASITKWAWSFGDGSTSSEQNPTHIYVSPGKYDVSLTVTTSIGDDTETKQDYIFAVSTVMDIDGSGTLNALDVQLVINAALGATIEYDADVDDSGSVDAIDVQSVINAVLGA